jgi:hypothetical protein
MAGSGVGRCRPEPFRARWCRRISAAQDPSRTRRVRRGPFRDRRGEVRQPQAHDRRTGNGIPHHHQPASGHRSGVACNAPWDAAVADRPPRIDRPAYLLEYDFGVSDGKGSRTETIRQTFYPFAEGGPVVFTPRHQKIDMSYGPVHFFSGWFEVPGRVVQKLHAMGLPDGPPEADSPTAAAPRLDPPSSRWPWFVGLAALTTGAGAVAGARRRTT